jgi:aminoglycoside 6-adenylyltransferase
VAKAQARGELFFARLTLDQDMTYDCLRTILEWRIELDRDWNWKPGAFGRGIERELPKEIADELEAAHDSVQRTIELFRRVAREVGERLGYAYPELADKSVCAYFEKLVLSTTA